MPKVNMNVSVKGDISKTEGTEGALNVLTASHAIEQDAIVKERERKALERGDAEYWKFRSAQLIHMENERRLPERPVLSERGGKAWEGLWWSLA